MKFTRPLVKCFVIAMLVLSQKMSYASGFPIKPHSWMISPSINYFFATKSWDSLRVKSPFSSNGRYNSVSLYIYSEYGISKRFAFIAQLPYVINNYQADNYSKKSAGLTDFETGLRYSLASIKNKYFFTLQGTLITPLYSDLNLGYRAEGGELKLAFACSGALGKLSYFLSVEDGVRQYAGTDGPTQNRYYGSFGLNLDKASKNQAIIALSGFNSSSNLNSSYNPSLVGSNKNFSFNQVTLSYGHAFTKRVTAYVAGSTFYSGRNTGAGSTMTASLVIKPF
jgi:hypothetical protein